MKKVLSIVLSLVMVLCMMPVMAFADTANAAYSDISGEKCEGAVNVLDALGVIDDYEDGTYRPDQVVTRAEMAKLIITALGVADYASATTSSYSDMQNAQWAIPYVEYATNLGIIEGVGGGRFSPGNPVTYEQAVTMIVRAIGYTTDCNEMNGTWPAIYVQKATALGLFKNVEGNQYGTGADRGDVAVMLYNGLSVPQVYADKDGETHPKTSADNQPITMMTILNKDGSSVYGIVSSTDVDGATADVRSYLGAAGKIVKDKNDDVIAISDIKTVFLTGEYDDDDHTFTVGDTEYTCYPKYKAFEKDTKTGKVVDSDNGVVTITNGITGSKGTLRDDSEYTIAATVDGKTITGIYSIATWDSSTGAVGKITESNLTQLTKNKKLLGKEFKKDNNGDIDTNSFILEGVDSLDNIAEDNIVTVYTDKKGTGAVITKVEVGTEVVTGEITRKYTDPDKITVDGKDYKFSKLANAVTISDAAIAPGNEVELYLDYTGKIYAVELVNGMAGNYAVVIDATTIKEDVTTSQLETGLNAPTLKAKMIFADGTVKTVEANVSKLNKLTGTGTGSILGKFSKADWNDIVVSGNLITYELDSDGKLSNVGDAKVVSTDASKDKKVTSSGYFVATAGTYMISDNAAIFKIKDTTTDEADYSVLKKDSLLGASKVKASYKLNDSNQIEVMVVTDSSDDTTLYGILNGKYTNSDNDTVMNGFIGKDALTDAVLDSGDYATDVLVELTKNGDGTYNIVKSATPAGTIKNNANQSATVKDNALYGLAGAYKKVFSSSVVVYVWDAKEKAYVVGTVDDINAAGSKDQIVYYETADEDDDDAGFITYVIIQPQA